MNRYRNHNVGGFTLFETVMACVILALIGFGICSVWIQAMWSYDKTATQTASDADAVLAMQHMIADVREAKFVTLVSATDMKLIFPIKNADGTYDRTIPDTNNPIDYLQSDSSGVAGRTGTWLWRKVTNGASRPVARDLDSILFESDTPASVKITITTRNKARRGDAVTQLTHRVVYLRNY